jgi:hypothetical protein
MPETKPLTTVRRFKTGRPKSIQKIATSLIGESGVAALKQHDLHIVHGRILRELATVVGESAVEPPLITIQPFTEVKP